MLNQFPRHGKIISILLIIFMGWLIWQAVKPPNYSDPDFGLKPGTPEYKKFHRNAVDTIPEDSMKKYIKEAGPR